MKTLAQNIKTSFAIKKSKFLCFGFAVKDKTDVKKYIEQLKKEYPDSSHICYSYILEDGSFYFTDGGEPSGTAGKPIYGSLQSFGLNYVLVVVVRYFGGIKLGTSLLRSTFKDVAMQTLRSAKIQSCLISDIVRIKISYSQIKNISQKFKNNIYKKQFEKEFVILDLIGDSNKITQQLSILKINPISVKEQQLII